MLWVLAHGTRECCLLGRVDSPPGWGPEAAFLSPSARLATSSEDSGADGMSVQQQRQEQSYFVRLGSLSERLRQQAWEHSLGKLRLGRQRAQEGLQQLAQALSLVSSPCCPGVPTGGARLASPWSVLHGGGSLPLCLSLCLSLCLWLQMESVKQGENQEGVPGPEESNTKPEVHMRLEGGAPKDVWAP